MKKTTLILLFITIFSLSVFSQTEDKTNWEKFAPNAEDFSLELPKLPKQSAKSVTDKYNSRDYRVASGETFYLISSHKNINDSPYKILYDFAAKNAVKILSNENERSDGEFVSFYDTEGFYQTILVVKTRRRFYIFHTLTEIENNSDIKRFFDSIKISSDSSTSDFTKEKGEFLSNIQPATQKNNSSQISQNLALQNGDSENKSNEISNQNEQKVETKKYKILFKPRANYTDLASYYRLTGTVTLRVTFLSNGKIGKISVANKLPFGITNEAIKAARSIRFEPESINGIPQTVIVHIVYNYTIF